MAEYKVNKSTILKDVRVLLDEQRDNSALISDEDTVSMETDDIIWSYIEQAVDEVHMSAAVWMIKDVTEEQTLGLSDAKVARGRGKFGDLPDTFMRLIRVDAEDWLVPCYEPIDQDSDEYLMQHSKWSGVKGNTERPVVAVVPGTSDSSIKLKLEVFTTSCSQVNISYVKRAQISEGTDPEVLIAKHCYRALLYTLAKYYLMTLGDVEKASLFGATAGGLMGMTETETTEATA